MFDTEQLKAIDSRYFNIITVEEYDVTIQSRNTGHYWYLHCTGVPGMRRVSSSTNINIVIPTTTMDAETVSNRRFGVYRAITGGR